MSLCLIQLLLEIPGIGPGIPGVGVEYIPNQGAIQATALEGRMMTVALAAAGVLFVIGAILALKSQWDAPQPWWAQIKMLVTVALMLSMYPLIFATPMILAGGAAEALFSGRDMTALNEDIRRASLAEMKERAENDPQVLWYERMAALAATINITSAVLLELVLALTTIIFYAAVAAMTFLWKFFVVVLYVTGPLLIVLGLVGGWGERILAAWVTALVQLSLWQVWFAICAFFVRSADNFFYTGDRMSSVPNHYESVALCILFTVSHISTPLIINALVPISTFSAGVARGLERGMSKVTGTGTRIVQVGSSGFKRDKRKEK